MTLWRITRTTLRAGLLTAVLALLPGTSRATTVDGLLFQQLPPSDEVQFDSTSGAIQFVFFPDQILLSDGQLVARGAGSTNGSAPVLSATSIESNLQTLLFSADPTRDYLTRFGSYISELGGGIQIELDFSTLRIEGELAQSTGLLIGSAILVSDELSVHPTAPVGSVVPITATVQLLNGAVFGSGLTDSDFAFTLDGMIDLAVPEPSTGALLAFGVVFVAARRRRTAG